MTVQMEAVPASHFHRVRTQPLTGPQMDLAFYLLRIEPDYSQCIRKMPEASVMMKCSMNRRIGVIGMTGQPIIASSFFLKLTPKLDLISGAYNFQKKNLYLFL